MYMYMQLLLQHWVQGDSSRFAKAVNESGTMLTILVHHSNVRVGSHGVDCEIHIASGPINSDVFYDTDHRYQSDDIVLEMQVTSSYP